MNDKKVIITKQNGYMIIQLNTPENRNALSKDLTLEFFEALKQAEDDPEVRALIVTGSGKAFCAGGDLRRFNEGFEPLEAYDSLKSSHDDILKLYNLSIPTIAAVNGYAVGAGFSLTMLHDIILADENAKFGLAFVNVGLVPDMGAMYHLPRLVGLHKAKELAYTGDNITAQYAHELGIVNHVYPSGILMEEACKLAEKFARGPGASYRQAKKAINASITLDMERALELEAYVQAISFQTEDHREAVAAFLEKRTPMLKGK